MFSSVSGENVRKLSIFSSISGSGGISGDSQYLKVEPQVIPPPPLVVKKKPSMVRHLSMQHSSGKRSGEGSGSSGGGVTIPENNLLKVEQQQQKQFNKRPQMKRHFSESGTGAVPGTALVPERSVVIPEDDLLKVERQQPPSRSNSQGHPLHKNKFKK